MMGFESWDAFYHADWQWPWAVWVAPWVFLFYRLASGFDRGGSAHGRFFVTWSWLFLFETMLDPIMTGPVATAIGTETAGTVLGLSFVLLGDFRVFWLVFALCGDDPWRREAMRRAALFTAAIPIFAYLVFAGAGTVLGGAPDQILWWTHETTFVVVSIVLARRFVPEALGDTERAHFLRRVLGYVAGYYALWAGADVLILSGIDAGWAIRTVPNQLYYALFVPFVWWQSKGVFGRAG